MQNNLQPTYKEVEPLTKKENGPVLVRNTQSGKFYVKKLYSIYTEKVLRQLKKIQHKNLPQIHDIIRQQNQLIAYEEYIHGNTLTEIIAQQRLDTMQILTISCDILDALEKLHHQQLIHRDIKPANIMVSNDGVVKLIDFDAVRIYNGDNETDTVQLGTIGFAAPEQYGFAESDRRSDLYSLGVVINVCHTKQYPRDNLTDNIYLKPIVTKATSLDPKDRYQDSNEMKMSILQQMKAVQSQSYALPKKQRASLKRYIPGYRKNNRVNKILATTTYSFLLIGIWAILVGKEDNYTKYKLVMDIIVLFILPILLFTNFLNYYNKLPKMLKNGEKLNWFGYLCIVVIYMLFYSIYIYLMEL